MASSQWQVGNIGLPQRMTLKEGIDPRASFGIEQRASDIDDPPARPHQPGGKIEQIILRRRKPAQPFGRKPPLGLGLAPPGARARTRRIAQPAIDPADEISECRELAPGTELQSFDYTRAGPVAPRSQPSPPPAGLRSG